MDTRTEQTFILKVSRIFLFNEFRSVFSNYASGKQVVFFGVFEFLFVCAYSHLDSLYCVSFHHS